MDNTFLSVVAFVAGAVILGATIGSIIRTLVLPRGLASTLSVIVGRKLVRSAVLFVASRFKAFETRDRILAFSAPLSLLAILAVWLLLLIVGYALIFWALIGGSFASALRETASSALTLGFATTPTPVGTVVDVLAAMSGLIVIALQIAYLPVLYGAFNRRETLVTMLQSRAGSPAWGPEILARHQIVGLVDQLPAFYVTWETWAADVAESHANYPVLIWFRSPHPYRSWVLALLSVMDSAALYLALCPDRAPGQARLCLRQGFTALHDIASALEWDFDEDPFPTDPIELSFDEYMDGVERLRAVGFAMERSPEDAWPHFKGWRVNYESLAYRLADVVVAAPGPWSGSRSRLPGMEIVPKTPVDRRPDDAQERDRPKGQTGY